MSEHPPPYGKDEEAGAPLVNQGYPPGQPGPPQQGYPPQQTTTVIVAPARLNHPDYLCFSIFNLLCCCFCIGIAAIVKSCATRDANDRGDPSAESRSHEALMLNRIALGIGIAMHLIWIVALIVLLATGAALLSQIWG